MTAPAETQSAVIPTSPSRSGARRDPYRSPYPQEPFGGSPAACGPRPSRPRSRSIGTLRPRRQISKEIRAVDAHAGGEHGRVIVSGVSDVPGGTMYAKMGYSRRALSESVVDLMPIIVKDIEMMFTRCAATEPT